MTGSTILTTPCPACGTTGSLRVEMRLVRRPAGTFTLAGTTFVGTTWPYLVCHRCGVRAPAALEGGGA